MSLEKDIESLARVRLLASMDHEALRLMAFAAEKRSAKIGDVLFRRGEPGDAGFVVLSGAVEMDGADRAGPRTRRVGPGALIGQRALLAAVQWPETATVREASSLMVISRALFARVLEEYPNNAVGVRRSWARHLHHRLTSFTG